MSNGSRYSRMFVILGVVLMVVGIILALANFTGLGLNSFSSFNQIFGIVRSNNNDVDVERTESVRGISHISVASVSDNINLIPVDSDEIKAHYYGSYSTSNPDYRPELVVEKKGSQLNIEIKYQSNHVHVSFFSNLKLDVYIPMQFKDDLVINSTSGEVAVGRFELHEMDYSNTSGNLNAEWIDAEKATLSTTSGETMLAGKFESFKYTTTSGNFVSDDFTSKKTEFNTTSGEISLAGQMGDVKAEAISGNLNFSYSHFGNTIEANTVSGEVEIRLPEDAGFELEYVTVSGDAQCDFAVSGSQAKKGLKGTVGSGEGAVRINKVSGNLKIRK